MFHHDWEDTKAFGYLEHIETEKNYTILTKTVVIILNLTVIEKSTCKHLVWSKWGSPKPVTSVITACFSIAMKQE